MARIANITDVCSEIFAGGDAPKGNMSIEPTPEFDVPIYSNGEANNGLYGYTNYARVTQPSITISARGTIGYAAIRYKPFTPIVRLITLVPKSELINIRYLYYAVQNYHFNGSGTSIPQLTVPMLKDYTFPLPDMEAQQFIANILDKVSDLIALRKQQLAKLDELVKARFMEIFGDIIHNNLNWPTFSLSDIANSRLGKMLDAKQQTGQYSFPYLANFNVQWFRFEIDELHKMDFNEADQKEFELRDGDLLVCEGGEVGRCAVWHNQVIPCYFQKALHRIRCNLEIIEPDYLSWWFKFHCDYNQFEDIVGSKATIAHLPGAKLKKLEVVVPPIDLQRQFSYFIAEVEKTRLTIRQGLDKLETMKKALMQEYFGEEETA